MLPEKDKEVLVKLDNGFFAVASYAGDDSQGQNVWLTGSGVVESREDEKFTLSGNVVSWSELPPTLENNLSQAPKRKM